MVTALSLDDLAAWRALSHAFGPADNLPPLLRAAQAAPRTSAIWSMLWETVWHQGTIYSASLAVAPHLLAFAEAGPANARWEPLQLFIAIALAGAQRELPPVPASILAHYQQTLAAAPPLLLRALRETSAAPIAQTYLAGLALLSGHRPLAAALFEADDQVVCPQCATTFPRYYELDEV